MAKRPRKRQRHSLFDLDEARADFVHAGQLGFWTPDEATAYSMGYVPSLVNPISIKPFLSSSPIAVEFERRREVVNRSILVEELTERVNPNDFLVWARRRRLEVPKDLTLALAPASDAPPDSCADPVEQKLREEIADLTRKNEALQRQNDPHPRRLRTYQKLLLAVGVKKYGYRPSNARSPAAGAIATDTGEGRLRTSDDAVRSCLREAVQDLEFDDKELEELQTEIPSS